MAKRCSSSCEEIISVTFSVSRRRACAAAVDVLGYVMNFLAVLVRNDSVVGRPRVRAEYDTVLVHDADDGRACLLRRRGLEACVLE